MIFMSSSFFNKISSHHRPKPGLSSAIHSPGPPTAYCGLLLASTGSRLLKFYSFSTVLSDDTTASRTGVFRCTPTRSSPIRTDRRHWLHVEECSNGFTAPLLSYLVEGSDQGQALKGNSSAETIAPRCQAAEHSRLCVESVFLGASKDSRPTLDHLHLSSLGSHKCQVGSGKASVLS